MLTKLCARCKKVIPIGRTYCDDCQQIADGEREERKAKADARYNRKRDPKYREFYNSKEWRTLRAVHLSEVGYMCEECKAKGINQLAEEVHHVEPINTPKGWQNRLNPNGLKALCVECHNNVHERWGGGRSKSMK